MHYNIEIVVCYEVFYYSNRTLLSFTEVLKRHGSFYLHHDALLEVWTALSEVLKLLNEENGLRVFVLGYVGFDRWQELLD